MATLLRGPRRTCAGKAEYAGRDKHPDEQQSPLQSEVLRHFASPFHPRVRLHWPTRPSCPPQRPVQSCSLGVSRSWVAMAEGSTRSLETGRARGSSQTYLSSSPPGNPKHVVMSKWIFAWSFRHPMWFPDHADHSLPTVRHDTAHSRPRPQPPASRIPPPTPRWPSGHAGDVPLNDCKHSVNPFRASRVTGGRRPVFAGSSCPAGRGRCLSLAGSIDAADRAFLCLEFVPPRSNWLPGSRCPGSDPDL